LKTYGITVYYGADQQKPGVFPLASARFPAAVCHVGPCRRPWVLQNALFGTAALFGWGGETVRWYDVLQNRSRMGGPVLGGRLPISANLLFYYCFGGTHSSPVAAALHLGLLSQAPSLAEIQSIPHFDRLPHKQVGTPLFWGRDVEGKLVCTIGTAGQDKAVLDVVREVCRAAGVPGVEFRPAGVCLHPFTQLGGGLSRRLGFVRGGRLLAAQGILRRWDCFLTLTGRSLTPNSK